jgi:hypothetical protein
VLDQKEINCDSVCFIWKKKIAKERNTREEEFKDTKGAISIRISQKNRQHNGQKKKVQTDNHLQNKRYQ